MKEKNSIIVIIVLILAIVSLTGYGIIKSTKKLDNKESKKEYTVEELEQMSKDYYSLIVEKKDNIQTSVEKNEDGTITIELYTQDGDKKNSLDWYTIDIKTATGKNTQNKKIDLKME